MAHEHMTQALTIDERTTYGRIAYERYGGLRHRRLPWERLPPTARDDWRDVAQAVVTAYERDRRGDEDQPTMIGDER